MFDFIVNSNGIVRAFLSFARLPYHKRHLMGHPAAITITLITQLLPIIDVIKPEKLEMYRIRASSLAERPN